jgi:hypothetical protein
MIILFLAARFKLGFLLLPLRVLQTLFPGDIKFYYARKPENL